MTKMSKKLSRVGYFDFIKFSQRLQCLKCNANLSKSTKIKILKCKLVSFPPKAGLTTTLHKLSKNISSISRYTSRIFQPSFKIFLSLSRSRSCPLSALVDQVNTRPVNSISECTPRKALKPLRILLKMYYFFFQRCRLAPSKN
jgi:hypothetical protein